MIPRGCSALLAAAIPGSYNIRYLIFVVVIYPGETMLTTESYTINTKDLERIRRLRPIDDDFMRCLFKDNISLVQLVLRLITGNMDLKIGQVETQRDMKRLAGSRLLILDVYAVDDKGVVYDLEIQREDHGADASRARYHSSVLDVEHLKPRQDFLNLPETYTIFITEHDIFRKGKPCYRIDRSNRTARKIFRDRAHIIYVNGQYRGDTELGKLMHDFCSSDPENMRTPLLRETVLYYKTNPEGVRTVCKIMDEVRQEGREQGIKQGRERGIKQGRKQGLEMYEKLIVHLSEDNRLEDLAEAAKNRDYARKLFREYHLV